MLKFNFFRWFCYKQTAWTLLHSGTLFDDNTYILNFLNKLVKPFLRYRVSQLEKHSLD